ncbi:MAG: DUF1512 domain-containing protein [Candidatus Bathyarchaeia archaeon]|nr:DUF1512 domain-containing protein [Candidatus Bathyarchaeota archaeon]
MFLTMFLFLFGSGASDGSSVGTLISTLMYLSFILFILFGQKIQLWTMLWNMSGALKKLEFMSSEAKALTVKTIKEIGRSKEDPSPRLNILLEHFLISPVDMDPAGIVWKFDHLLDVRDSKFKDDVRMLAPEADEVQINNLENLVEGALALNTIYRVVRHFYLLGRKTQSFYLILQLQMILPLVMQEAEALVGATKAFALGQPIGDGIGPLVASKLMRNSEKRKVEKDIVVSEVDLEGRRVLALKAEGPGGNVGKPGDAIRQLIEERNGQVSMVLMIDAAVKFEGEKTGDISEGIGAAIGGIGTERFKIEEEVSKFKIPLHALIVKESIQEAIMPMRREIAEAADKVISRIKNIIKERTKEADTVIVAGIGNTIGIGQ